MAWFVRGIVTTLSLIGVWDLVGEDLTKDKTEEDLIGPPYDTFGSKIRNVFRNIDMSSWDKKALMGAIFWTIWKYQDTLIKSRNNAKYKFRI